MNYKDLRDMFTTIETIVGEIFKIFPVLAL